MAAPLRRRVRVNLHRPRSAAYPHETDRSGIALTAASRVLGPTNRASRHRLRERLGDSRRAGPRPPSPAAYACVSSSAAHISAGCSGFGCPQWTRKSKGPRWARISTVMPTSWLCRPRRWIACSVRDLRRRGRHSPRPIVGVDVARDRDRDSEDGGMAAVGIHIRETLHLPRRWDSRAVCLRRVRRRGQREAPRRLRLKPPVRARETAGLCRPREPESPAPQGNPRPRRHNDEVGMTIPECQVTGTVPAIGHHPRATAVASCLIRRCSMTAGAPLATIHTIRDSSHNAMCNETCNEIDITNRANQPDCR